MLGATAPIPQLLEGKVQKNFGVAFLFCTFAPTFNTINTIIR